MVIYFVLTLLLGFDYLINPLNLLNTINSTRVVIQIWANEIHTRIVLRELTQELSCKTLFFISRVS